MSNPFEYREVMKAAFSYNETRTVEQVVAEQEARHDAKTKETARMAQRRSAAPATAANPEEPTASKPIHIDANKVADVRKLLEQAAALRGEPASISD